MWLFSRHIRTKKAISIISSIHSITSPLVLIEDDRLAFLHRPAIEVAKNTFAAKTAACVCVRWNFAFLFLKINIWHRKIIRIIRHPVAQCAQHDTKVLREYLMNVKVPVYDLILFRKAQELDFGKMFGDANHHGKIVIIIESTKNHPSNYLFINKILDNVYNHLV